MQIIIDTTRIDQFFQLPPDQMLWEFFINIGWIFIAILFLLAVCIMYLQEIRSHWAANNLKYIILAIDVPKGNEQSPKAVENMFTYLAGAHGDPNFFEKWFEGKFQVSFSYEIVSLEGYTQFLIRTPIEYRDLIETSVYSQYPDAEIAEVDDYVDTVPHRFPDEDYDVWGTEFIQSKHWAFPIKLYPEFEHNFGPSETQFKDPMASFMDLCSSLREGENLWLQLIIIPIGFDWVEESEAQVDKIIGRNKASKGLASKLVEWIGDASEVVYSIWGDIEAKSEERPKMVMELDPKKQKQIEAIELKSAKLAFKVKIRAVYVARKDLMSRSKVVSGLIGYIKQFISLHLNNLKPDLKYTMTKTSYFNKKKRLIKKKNAIMSNYVNRDDSLGRQPGIYNIEELATLWHFPLEANVKSSMIQKAPGRKAGAPSSLPVLSDIASGSPQFFQEEVLAFDSKKAEAVKDYEESTDNEVDHQSQDNRMDFKVNEEDKIPDNLPFV